MGVGAQHFQRFAHASIADEPKQRQAQPLLALLALPVQIREERQPWSASRIRRSRTSRNSDKPNPSSPSLFKSVKSDKPWSASLLRRSRRAETPSLFKTVKSEAEAPSKSEGSR